MQQEPSSTRSEFIDPAAKTYLSAIGASAIYVAVDKGAPISVGVARDLDKALRHLHRLFTPAVTFGWIAWGLNYNKLAQIAQMPDLLYVRGVHDIKVALQLPHLVQLIEQIAREGGCTLTPHDRALERAQVYAGYLDKALDDMQRDGTFAAFNQAYKAHRQECARTRASVQPFWAVMQQLRAVVIRALVADPKNRMSSTAVVFEIRKQFPWFTRPVHVHMRPPKHKRH
jgi:hypothetical protein